MKIKILNSIESFKFIIFINFNYFASGSFAKYPEEYVIILKHKSY
jgi:hypothetical protein